MNTSTNLIEKAEKIVAALIATGKFPRAKVWQSGDVVRAYTGERGEYLDITETSVTKCRLNMTWGHLINVAQLNDL